MKADGTKTGRNEGLIHRKTIESMFRRPFTSSVLVLCSFLNAFVAVLTYYYLRPRDTGDCIDVGKK